MQTNPKQKQEMQKGSRKRQRTTCVDVDDSEHFVRELVPITFVSDLEAAIADSKFKITGYERMIRQEQEKLLNFQYQHQRSKKTLQSQIDSLLRCLRFYHEHNVFVKLAKCYKTGPMNYIGQIAVGKVTSVNSLQTKAYIELDAENEMNFTKKSRYHKKKEEGFDFKIGPFSQSSNVLLCSNKGVFLQLNTRVPAIYEQLVSCFIPDIAKIILECIS